MKYNDNGTYKDIYVKAFDTLPVGAEIEYNGQVIPNGWEQVVGYEEVSGSDYITFNNSVTVNTLKAFKCGSIVFVNFDIAATISAGETVLGTATNKLAATFYGIGRVARWSSSSLQSIGPATFIAISGGALRIYTTFAGTNASATLMLLVND